MNRLADCRKAFTSRCPHLAEIRELGAQARKARVGALTYYDPKCWEQAWRFCGGCEDFEPIRHQAGERTGPEVPRPEASPNL